MKKVLVFLIVALIVAQVAACQGNAPPAVYEDSLFPGKIAIVTSAPDQTLEENYAAQYLVSQYGSDKILHYIWPENFMEDHMEMISIMAEIAADPDIKVVIINQAVFGTNRAVDKLRETRKDVFVIYCEPAENYPDIAIRADLMLSPDHYKEGPDMVNHAKERGAKTFVHYSFPRHLAMFSIASRLDMIIEACEEQGLEFVAAQAPDPTGPVGLDGAQQFILEDVPKMIAEYGEDTAFFATNCGMQPALISAVADHRGIYTRPCCPSPLHGFPEAFGIEADDFLGSISYVISETKRLVAERGLTGRLSTWPVPVGVMLTVASTEYAIMWINGETPDEGVDKELFTSLCEDYVRKVADSDATIDLTVLEESGIVYENILMLMMGYLVY